MVRVAFISSLVSVLVVQGVQGQTPSCLGYSKGAFSGDVITKDVCETACETAEGLPIPDFKIAECSVTTDLNETVTAIDYDCSCVRKDTSGSTELERRSLCKDPVCASGGAAVQQWIATFSAMAFLFLW